MKKIAVFLFLVCVSFFYQEAFAQNQQLSYSLPARSFVIHAADSAQKYEFQITQWGWGGKDPWQRISIGVYTKDYVMDVDQILWPWDSTSVHVNVSFYIKDDRGEYQVSNYGEESRYPSLNGFQYRYSNKDYFHWTKMMDTTSTTTVNLINALVRCCNDSLSQGDELDAKRLSIIGRLADIMRRVFPDTHHESTFFYPIHHTIRVGTFEVTIGDSAFVVFNLQNKNGFSIEKVIKKKSRHQGVVQLYQAGQVVFTGKFKDSELSEYTALFIRQAETFDFSEGDLQEVLSSLEIEWRLREK